MIPEIAHFFLILALLLSAMLAVLPFMSDAAPKPVNTSQLRLLVSGISLGIMSSFVLLAYCFYINDFSVAYVAAHSNAELPIFYRICAVWGAHEGSMLLWVTILSGWLLAVSLLGTKLPQRVLIRVTAVLGALLVGLILFILATSDPFLRLLPSAPSEGHELNPMLQDFGLAIHPPLLYLGYVGFAVPFAMAMAVLWLKEHAKPWYRWVQPWALMAFAFLTAGIILGSWWAYRELGWGGFWFWDPVENASLLPWLCGSALIHSLIVSEKRGALHNWTLLLAIITFSLSLLGTFLVRSGVLTSVHAFANDPKRGMYLFAFLFVVTGSSLIFYALRRHAFEKPAAFLYLSRESFILVNNLLLSTAAFTVLLGTIYPLVLEALNLGSISVGAPYFNSVFIPIISLVLLFMGIAPYSQWYQTSGSTLSRELRLSAALTLAAIVLFVSCERQDYLSIGEFVLISWTTLSTVAWLYQNKHQLSFRKVSFAIAHLGFAVTALGILLSSSFGIEKNLRVHLSEHFTVGPYELVFNKVQDIVGPNYTGLSGQFSLFKNGKLEGELSPERRFYPNSKTILSDAAVDVGIFRDIYLALANPIDDNNYVVRAYYKPFVRWIWAGGIFIIIGAMMSVIARSHDQRKLLLREN